MSAPEPQVRVHPGGWRCRCGQIGFIFHGQTQDDMERLAAEHEATCPLAALQARWDARDEVLRGLIENWRHPTRRAIGLEVLINAAEMDCADELERAVRGDG